MIRQGGFMAEKHTETSTGRKVLTGVIAVLLLLTVAAYGFGVYYFTLHFLPGSLVNGFNCSYMDEAETEDLLTQATDAYVLAVQTRGNGQESISADEIDLSYQPDGSVRKLLRGQNRFLWFLSFGQHKTYEVSSSVSCDGNLLEQKIDSLNCMKDNIAPVDARIEDNGESFEIVPETVGTQVNRERLDETILRAVTSGDTVVNLEEDGCYDNPSVYADDERLIKDCEQMNELTDVVITYDFGDRKETVDREVIRGWLTRDENGDLILDKEQISAYVVSLGEKYDTVGLPRTFETYDNREVALSGGDYGWVIDREKEADALYQAVTDQKTQVREPVYQQSAMSRDTNDIGYTYVEIDLPNHRLVVYRDGVPVVDTGILSSSATPEGVYKIQDMQSPADVNGKTVNYRISFGEGLGIQDDPEINFDNMFTGNYDAGDSGSGFVSWAGTGGNVLVSVDQAALIWQNVTEDMPIVVYKN